MHTIERFIAAAERDVKVVKAMAEALDAMTLVDLAAVELAEGARYKLTFTRQIAGLREALYLMGEDTN